MAINLYNYLTRKKEEFKSTKKKEVGFYSCGPTVYDKVHIGNLRTYIFEDILKRTLEYNNYKVKHITNITDIEDKIIKKMQSENKTLEEITKPYIGFFYEDLKDLNIKKADKYPLATLHIKQMIKIISKLLKKEVAYKSEDGSVYFDISKFKKYGDFSRLDKENLEHGKRISNDEYDKKNIGDFVLWKKTSEGEPSWNAPFGKGRPGWHIECSAMSEKYLGKNFDIHAGAVDLIFPHHENEIAQSEAVNEETFVNYWVEGEHLLVDNKKMSKSLGNFYTLNDIKNKKIEPLAFRYLALNTHYRNKLNFTWESLESAQNGLRNLKQQVLSLGDVAGKVIKTNKEEFLEKINNDLNTPQALAVLQSTLKSNLDKKDKLATILDFDKVLGLGLGKSPTKIPKKITDLAEKRKRARKEKNWKESDKIREEINKLGYKIEDTPNNDYVVFLD